MSQQEQMPDWYGAENEAHQAVDALDKATKQIGLVLSDPDSAHFVRTKRFGDVIASHIRMFNVAHEMTEGATS